MTKSAERVFFLVLKEGDNRDEINKRIKKFKDEDWRNLYKINIKYGLLPIFYHRLINLKLENIPSEILSNLKNTYIFNLKRNITLERELFKIISYFKESNIPAMPLKGPVMARYLYGDLALRRTSADLDVLVKPEYFKEAEGALKKADWVSYDEKKGQFSYNLKLKYTRQLYFSKKIDTLHNLSLDLHLDVCELYMHAPLDDFWRNLREVDFESGKALMPSNEGLFIYLSLLCINIKDFIQLRYLYDIYAFVSRYKKELDWDGVINSIKGSRYKDAVFFALTLSRKFFDFGIPENFLHEIQPSGIKRLLLRAWINRRNALYREDNPGYKQYLFFVTWNYFAASYLYSKDIFDCIRIIYRKIFLPMDEMVAYYNEQPSKEACFLYIERLLTPISHLFKRNKNTQKMNLKFKSFIIRKNTTDAAVFRSIFVFKELDLPVELKPNLIIDGGAYTGLSSLYFSSKYPNAKIIAVEPEESNFKILKKNTKNVPNITVINAGLWYKDCFLKIRDKGTRTGFMTEEAAESKKYDVNAVTIIELLRKSGFDKIDILKLDIEGAEKELFLKDYDSWLGKTNIIIIELHDRFKEGCTQSFNSAINKYEWDYNFKRGEKVVLIRKNTTEN